MKKKGWIFYLIVALLAAVCFVNLWKYETDPMKVISNYYGLEYQNHIRYLLKIMAYVFSYMVVAGISCYFLRGKTNGFKCIVVFVTSLVLVFCVLLIESWVEWATWEYLFDPEVGYTVWFVLKGEVRYSAMHWLAALRYILAFLAYPVIYVFIDRELLLKTLSRSRKNDAETIEDFEKTEVSK